MKTGKRVRWSLIAAASMMGMITMNGSQAAASKMILIPLPRYGFDPSESAVPWNRLREAGHQITFATPDGLPGEVDRRLITGDGFPLFFKSQFMAAPAVIALYGEMKASPEYRAPITYDRIAASDYDALLLPGGHDKGMREYLESPTLHAVAAELMDAGKPVAAICHGTLVVARAISARTGKSPLWGRKTTGLTHVQEMLAYHLTRFRLGDYYRTYSTTVEDEIKSILKDPRDFDRGRGSPITIKKDSDYDLRPGFALRDGNYLSARWPGDAHRFSAEFVKMLAE